MASTITTRIMNIVFPSGREERRDIQWGSRAVPEMNRAMVYIQFKDNLPTAQKMYAVWLG